MSGSNPSLSAYHSSLFGSRGCVPSRRKRLIAKLPDYAHSSISDWPVPAPEPASHPTLGDHRIERS
jgi:hypothetical protein